MGAIALPTPTLPPANAAVVDLKELERRLQDRVDGEVRFDLGSKGAYATDASNFRRVPLGVVIPRTIDAGAEALSVCAEAGAPVVSRGGGTSLAGQACNVAVVIDWSKYCHRIESIDADARTAVVEPGVVLDQLDNACAPYGLQFGPRPSTHSRCTIGGMIGNNSCGSTAQAYGKTVDNVRRLEIVTADGVRMWVGPTSDEQFARIVEEGGRRAEIYLSLRSLIDTYGDEVRDRYPHTPRRVSGYNLDSLLPENGFDVARALVGSEGTLAMVLRAEIELVPMLEHRGLVMLGYPTIEDAADAVPRIVAHEPLVVEGLDERLLRFEREKHRNDEAVNLLPEGEGWLMVQMGAEEPDELDRRLSELVADATANGASARRFMDQDDREKLWAIRESGLGATAWAPEMDDSWPGFEDSAVPPESFGDYLRDFGHLLDEFGYGQASRYGHFGHGCLHIRIPFHLTTAAGVDAYREFLQRAAHLVTSYGGSLSGEHGDGQQRGSLLGIMFGDRVIEAFRALKRSVDPQGLFNPGRLVDPDPVDAHLRLGTSYAPPAQRDTHFQYPHDHGSFDRAALRCVGVGQCRSHESGVMCPSYRATGEEEHSTRGRSRLLFEMLNGREDGPITDGWRSHDVKEALDLCLACKGCKTDCPVDVDMATYKAEFMSHHYEGRLRPMAHYSIGWIPVWARLASLAPRLVNRVSHAGPLGTFAKRVAGIEPDRPMPTFASERFTDWFRKRSTQGRGHRGDVMLWPDTFSNNLHPHVAKAAVEVLETVGYRVTIPEGTPCCGLTLISTGQLGAAERTIKRTVRLLAPHVRAGGLVVGLEPSCTAVFRSDAPDMFPHDQDVARLRDQTRTLAELLEEADDWEPPRVDRDALVQPHCHQHAVLSDADEHLLERMGVRQRRVSGCCGLAGNFGYEKGHLGVSVACADHELLPELDEADEQDVVLADGFSCRTQVEHLGNGRQALHLSELLAGAMRGDVPQRRPEERLAYRPAPPEQLAHRDHHVAAARRSRQSTGWPT